MYFKAGARFTAILSIMLQASWIFPMGASIELKDKNPEAAKAIVEGSLKKLGSSFKYKEDTEGFDYYLTNTFFNVYTYDIYISSYDQKNTVVRVDAPNRMSFALADVIEQQEKITNYPHKYGEKSLLLGDATTLISPGLGYIYANSKSPFARENIWFIPIVHFGVDALLFWFGSGTFFTHKFDPFGEGAIATATLMGTYRLAFLTKYHMQMVAQNRMVRLGYTFRF